MTRDEILDSYKVAHESLPPQSICYLVGELPEQKKKNVVLHELKKKTVFDNIIIATPNRSAR